jgi:hypothetical protein
MMRSLMRWILLAVSLIGACTSESSTITDFGVVLPGCRAPNACWRIHCNCLYAMLDDCIVCDPRTAPDGVCVCDQDAGGEVQCLERAQVCVGHAATTCDGKCVHPGFDMALQSFADICSADGDPPNVVPISGTDGDAGPATERRCAFADDICCE